MEANNLLTFLRRCLPWLGVMTLVALLYDGAIFYSRWSQARAGEREAARLQAEEARKTLQMIGSDELRIISFYASPGAIRSGGHASLCYGVNAAKEVRLDPPVADVWPSRTRCVQVAPRSDTTYTLTARDAGGHSLSQSVLLRVVR